MKLRLIALVPIWALIGACASLPQNLLGPRTVVLNGEKIKYDIFQPLFLQISFRQITPVLFYYCKISFSVQNGVRRSNCATKKISSKGVIT